MPDFKDNVAITFEGDFVRVTSDGDKSFERSEWLWPHVVKVCREHECYKVLGIAHSTAALPIMDGFAHADLFKRLGITHEYRFAWVELVEEAYENVRFIEDVLVNRGIRARVFQDIAEAKKWLLSDSDTQAIGFVSPLPDV